MIDRALAKFFRWSNSKLIATDNIFSEKILKIIFYLSLKVYRKSKPTSVEKSHRVTVDNFDSNIRLSFDRSRAMGAALYWTGFHEFREFLFLHRYLKPEMIFVDVGANLGEYSLFAAKRLTGGGVMAFEPVPSIRAVLEENIRLNGFRNIAVYPVGLSSQNEQLNIHEFDDVHEGLATLFPGDRVSASATAVPLKKLDDVVSEAKLARIDFIKIDIEGGELKALQGSKRIIEIFRPVFMIEINQDTYTTAGYTIADVSEFFRTFGYQAFDIQKGGRLQKCDRLPAFGNIIFMPQ